jgi:type III pantothenate kinase
MMLLDVGNTTIRWALRGQDGLVGQGHFIHHGREFAGLAGTAWSGLNTPDAMAVANVAGAALQEAITRWALEHWNLQPLFLKAAPHAAGVTNGYALPGQLGVDRWAAMVAAWHEQQSAVLVVDCGSAITLDFVDAGGRHHGGMIAPGLQMMRHSLSHQTANIDILPTGQAGSAGLLANATEAAIINGTIRMATAMIERTATDIAGQSGDGIRVVMTGGDAPVIRPLLDRRTTHDPDLVLKGVAILAEEQT